MARPHPVLLFLLLFQAVAIGADESKLPPPADQPVDFVRDIQPIFKSKCYSCHDGAKQRGGLRLDLKAAALKGGESFSPAIIAGKSAESPLIRVIAGLEEGLLMPPEGERLTVQQIGLLRAWIDQGAKWPDSANVVDDVMSHWSFQPVVRKPIPASDPRQTGWSRNPLDPFVIERLKKEAASGNLAPSAEADRVTLIRRLSFDLIGLPPTPADVAEFVADKNPDAYERLVDRLLASPHFGERWARHWLDVVRFAESDGFETNQPRPNAWPYRDYVINAINDDRPYEQFIAEQLAGDAFGVDEATGFIVGGAWDRVKSPDPGLTAQQRADELHDMVSTTGSAFLGLTVGCARCHNHKFDPISQVDYYAMKAIFAGVQHGERPVKPIGMESREQQINAVKEELARVDDVLRAFEPLAYVTGSEQRLASRGAVKATLEPKETSPEVPSLFLDDDTPPTTNPRMPSVTQLVPRLGLEPHRAGAARGQASDPGDARRFPNLGKNYSYWNEVANKDVFTWNPHVAGSYHVWLSWGCGWKTHAADARYILDRDGDLATKEDQQEIARIDQRRFADGTEGDQQPLWSGFYNAGVHEWTPTTRLILRDGETNAYVTADLLFLQEVRSGNPEPKTALPHLRPSVHRKTNVERFAPIKAQFVRFVIEQASNGSQPCIDELEVFSAPAAGTPSRNIALEATPTSSSNLPGYEIHQLKHINDGRYGNSASWISNEAGRGWVQLEFAQPVEIDRILWSRDRPENGQFSDRIPTKYRIEAGLTPTEMVVVASSEDRFPIERNLANLPTRSGLNEREQAEATQLAVRRDALTSMVSQLTQTRQVYAGRFTAPEPTNRFHRGDPLQPREPVAPAGFTSFGPEFKLPPDSPEATRRLKLTEWMTSPEHPLTRRVFVNRLWHFHFGQGLVTTPSDFGRNGARPSHPELLDWLASEAKPSEAVPRGAARNSPKRLHRMIVTSAAYRQSGVARPEGMSIDAGSRLFWRYPPRRLEAEPLRDAILAVCGNLDDRMGGPGFDLFEPNTNYVKVYNSRHEFGAAEWRRMVYQSKPRMQLDDLFGQFDCPDAGQITPKRTSSITALQALNLLNSQFMVQQSNLFAGRVEREASGDKTAQIRRAFDLIFLRAPTADELTASNEIVEQHGLPALCRALLNANEFLFVY